MKRIAEWTARAREHSLAKRKTMVNDYIQTKVHNALYGAGDIETSNKRRNVFARAYLARRKAWTDPTWIDIYSDWLKSGGEEIGLDKLVTYACINYKPMSGHRGYITK